MSHAPVVYHGSDLRTTLLEATGGLFAPSLTALSGLRLCRFRRAYNPRLNAENRRANQPVVEAIKNIARRKNVAAAQVALAWILAQRTWIVPIPGTTKLHRAKENIAAAEIAFSPQELAEIDAVFAGIDVHGERYTASWGARVGQRV